MAEATPQTETQKRRWLPYAIGSSVLSAIIVLVAVLTTRPKNLVVTQSQELESLPSLIKGASLANGTIGIEFTQSLKDMTDLFYYLNLYGDLNASVIEEQVGLENPFLYLVPDMVSMESELLVGQLDSVTFPFKLSDSFLPGNFEGVLLAENKFRDSDNNFFFPFLVVDPSRDIATPTTAPISSNSPTVAPTSPRPTLRGATQGPTIEPTPVPTFAPIPPTNAPVAPPTSPPLPEALVGNLDGNYNIEGTITIDYVAGLENGQVVQIPRLQFDVNAVSAPGPYLYISKRPFSETQNGRLTAADIEIEIDGVFDGAFTKGGVFEQVFDEIDNVQELREYEGGSFVVWCEPFGVWLGGGPIQAIN